MHAEYMTRAIQVAMDARTPFGALILTKSGKIIACPNTSQNDGLLAHAEMNALRSCRIDPPKIVYSTAEPCPMCFAAMIWSGVREVYYGVDIPTINMYMAQINVRAESLNAKSFHECRLEGGILKEECETLFRRFA